MQYKKRKEGFNYWLKQEINEIAKIASHQSVFRVDDGQHPRLLKLAIGKKISIETLLVMDYHLDFLKDSFHLLDTSPSKEQREKRISSCFLDSLKCRLHID